MPSSSDFSDHFSDDILGRSSDHYLGHSSDHSLGSAAASENAPPRRGNPFSHGRQASVYDAVAGRVAGRYFQGAQRGIKTWTPEDTLFRRKNAPARYAEADIYWANENLPDGGRRHLPQSDMLKCVHSYSSKFYEAMASRHGAEGTVGSRIVDERSMDETALLAFGVLLEEASREVLGKRGDLVLTEGKRAKKVESEPPAPAPQSKLERKPKRRKLDDLGSGET
ncbi:hypothetical protein B0H67DRAFT_551851 [Lasiosphaeris hirsuta]|uniref:Uncharacterized protein n=1 Tax=Lasiosphaeris hirsuta TaxID=260670 RepID=A0AA40APC0_9PEZI|nr:hypothetical protein B0H67DRAFT_551851 [Lasiosphaeris hirsuta]